jgi:TonB family protein
VSIDPRFALRRLYPQGIRAWASDPFREIQMRTSNLLLLATSSALLLTATVTAQAACDPTVVASPTRYPLQSQVRGQQGVVFLEVKVDESGRVEKTRLLRSSGHERLDRAASLSIRDSWQFNVTGCERKDLPASDLIAVEYRYDSEK